MSDLKIPVTSTSHDQFINITNQVSQMIPPGFNGLCNLFCQHTTAGLTINENADPDVLTDLTGEFKRIVPWENLNFRHFEGNSAAHLKASMVGFDLTLPVKNGSLRLGRWQGIYFCEFDGPRARYVLMTLLGGTPEE